MAGKRRLYTSGEIADMLGVTRQRALQLANDRRQDFPEPFDTLPGNVQVWLIEDVDAWMAEHRPPLDEADEGE
ncbi:helix-turn-helix domain-containing protein [Actinoplanes sp. M2I2]|uniref:helix-turn-helix transcriptional regulator n=1 Tax=Actinoplanes sp. M2I2 TaxID=1734444 RepID=UPI0020203140|nr:helix-turn-helix domain-containing protein [Actinoplanes sp. M2I2]